MEVQCVVRTTTQERAKMSGGLWVQAKGENFVYSHILAGKKSSPLRCAIGSYLVELIHCECSAGLEDSSHLPAGKHCPGVFASAVACTPV